MFLIIGLLLAVSQPILASSDEMGAYDPRSTGHPNRTFIPATVLNPQLPPPVLTNQNTPYQSIYTPPCWCPGCQRHAFSKLAAEQAELTHYVQQQSRRMQDYMNLQTSVNRDFLAKITKLLQIHEEQARSSNEFHKQHTKFMQEQAAFQRETSEHIVALVGGVSQALASLQHLRDSINSAVAGLGSNSSH
ncbi:hypothetical protein [Candidatus Finniella inopinata]|uniref:OmpH family outer membrane protein n=1 Tax=Candidatus Finniella inopinata TaxID=1696036 RepID=A0A4V2DZT5_9PROT|nr:hypothetical protein [Candidatus Finniella inopinata]RZI46177.1 hypothetical protein EQU50_04375 [Candidatus Finniella inopinata]